MKINTSKFITSSVSKNDRPSLVLQEVAISGRSNVGKSTLINYLLNRKSIAKTSSKPGKTRLINYFSINEKFYLVDLPGYGYSRVSKAEQNKWKKFIEEYLNENENLKLVLQLIDCRHELKESDKMMIEFLKFAELPYLIILTKSDKLSKNKLYKQIAYFKREIKTENIITSSSLNKQGKDIILGKIKAELKI